MKTEFGDDYSLCDEGGYNTIWIENYAEGCKYAPVNLTKQDLEDMLEKLNQPYKGIEDMEVSVVSVDELGG